MIRLLLWIAGLGLVLAGALRLDLPATGDPATPVFEAVRVVVAGLAAYLLVATALAAAGRARALTPAGLRRFVRSALVAGVLVGHPAAALAGSEPPVMRRVPAEASTSTSTSASASTTAPPTTAPAAPAPQPPPPPAPPTPPPTTWTVQPGQHFWAIARALAEDGLGRAPTDREIDPVWRRLVADNRSRFPDPDHLHPGDQVTIRGETAT